MKALIQRVRYAQVVVEDQVVAQIQRGLLVFIGIDHDDSEAKVNALSDRLLNYRVFADDQGRMNLSVMDSQAELLLVSQFTLSANTTKGLRPGFSSAASPARARVLYQHVVARISERYAATQTGKFGADMQVSLQNDGPVTFLLEN